MSPALATYGGPSNSSYGRGRSRFKSGRRVPFVASSGAEEGGGREAQEIERGGEAE